MNIVIPLPAEDLFTIYSKSGCVNCVSVKTFLKDKSIGFTVIDCDEFILEDKPGFLEFIHKLAGKECKVFPMVFYGKHFIGGFKETQTYIEEMKVKTTEKNLDFDVEF